MKEIDVPYELPVGWEWTRLVNIANKVFAGGDRPNIVSDIRTTENPIPIYSNGLKRDGLYGYTDKAVVNEEAITVSARGTIGFPVIRKEPFVPIIRLITITTDKRNFNLNFLKHYFTLLMPASEGSSIPQLTVPKIKPKLIAVPPLQEQHQIVRKIQILLKVVEQIEYNQNEISQLSELFEKRVLDTAMRGKLVPQDPNDEPASLLLEKIREEKQKLYEEGKLRKKDLEESIIFKGDDNSYYQMLDMESHKVNIPFEIPSFWNWAKLGEISTIVRGGSPRPIQKYITDSEDGVNWIKIGDTKQGGKYITSTKEKIIKDGLSKTRMVHAGDFLLSNSMSFGRPYITKIDGAIHDGWLAISDFEQFFIPDFLYYYLFSDVAFSQFIHKASGTAVKNLNRDKVASIWIPVVPLNQQKIIVNKLDATFKYTNALI